MMKWVALLSGLLLWSPAVHAQDIERARELFREASDLRAAGLYGDAVDRLRKAIAIKDTPGLEYHAGYCESKLGHYRSAIRYYERAAELLRQGIDAPDVVGLLPPAHAAALEHVAKLRLYVATSESNARFRLDGEAEQAIPDGDLLVDPGRHHLVFSAPGYIIEERDVAVSEAEVLNLQINLSPATRLQTADASATTSDFPWKTVSIGVGLGVTAGGLSIGIGSAFKRRDAQRQLDFYLSNGQHAGDPIVMSVSDDRSSAARWETIGFVSAGVGAAATCVLWALWPSSKAVRVSAVPEHHLLNVAADF